MFSSKEQTILGDFKYNEALMINFNRNKNPNF